MSSHISTLIGLGVAICVSISFYFQGKRLKAKTNPAHYAKLKQQGQKLRFKSAILDGQRYSGCMEFIITDSALGMRCYWPSFSIITKYKDLTLSKSRALIGSRVRLHISGREEKIEISHSLAKKLKKLSNGKFGYHHLSPATDEPTDHKDS
ncbi:hypothetical protein [Celerinatantimonas diazotrophica]|uniref:Uncharacterized protein n=1 Tax=Celerinatantimonas diazotrophica TaxID=412034 RepID=A0A4R1JLY3_9GAMM|nr:hypothetical protein [Celerinatantimonas diazotrophica]TCK52017.1 hypothetical protein EV690_2117 [Celerinatantimonas diazotrophica]CAG9296280.1 hypothetical protein CEDIAZO_01428 [Celerinatantimonas diazotrophica]